MQDKRRDRPAALHREAPAGLGGCVVTIGAFDGVHRGHQALMGAAIRSAAARALPAVAWTFDPPPKVFFGRAPLLMPAPEKVRRIGRLGVDHVILSRFDEAFRSRPAERFLEDLAALEPAEVWVGEDFRFGARQGGDVAMLARRFAVRHLDPVLCGRGERVSSSRIRRLWSAGDLEACRDLLGWADFHLDPGCEPAW